MLYLKLQPNNNWLSRAGYPLPTYEYILISVYILAAEKCIDKKKFSVSLLESSSLMLFVSKWALGSNTMNKASGGDGVPVELFQILKDDAVKMLLHSICQQIWNTQQWP